MTNKKSFFLRFIRKTDPDGKTIGYDKVEDTNDPYVIDSLNKECAKNKEAYEKKEAERIEKLNFINKYALKKLIIAINYGYPRGLVPSEHRETFITQVDTIIHEQDKETRANLIYDLLKGEGMTEFASFFDNLED